MCFARTAGDRSLERCAKAIKSMIERVLRGARGDANAANLNIIRIRAEAGAVHVFCVTTLCSLRRCGLGLARTVVSLTITSVRIYRRSPRMGFPARFSGSLPSLFLFQSGSRRHKAQWIPFRRRRRRIERSRAEAQNHEIQSNGRRFGSRSPLIK